MSCTVVMPDVMTCSAEKCVYNKASMCHARGITVGGVDEHNCDTLLKGSKHTERQMRAGVGACRALGCIHNEDFECQAENISIKYAGDQAECMTFASS